MTADLRKASLCIVSGAHLQLCIQLPDPDMPPGVPNHHMLLPAVAAHAVHAVQPVHGRTEGEQQAGSAAHLPHPHATITCKKYMMSDTHEVTYRHTYAPATHAHHIGPSHDTCTSRAGYAAGDQLF